MYEPVKKLRKPLTATQKEAGADNIRLGRLHSLLGLSNSLLAEFKLLLASPDLDSKMRWRLTDVISSFVEDVNPGLVDSIELFEEFNELRKARRLLIKETANTAPANSPPTP